MKEKLIISPDTDKQKFSEETSHPHKTNPESNGSNEPTNEGSGMDAVTEFTRNEEVEQRPNLTLREILGGDILTAKWVRQQMPLIVLCSVFSIIYITNRYSAEQELIDIERLKVELQDMKHRSLTRSSELTEKTRQSHIEDLLKQKGDTTLRLSKEPAYIIKIPRKE